MLRTCSLRWSLPFFALSLLLVGCFGSSAEEPIAKGNGTAVSVTDTDGNPVPVKGGTMLSNIPNWPENLRLYGTGSNTYLNSIVEGLCYESLCSIDPGTLEFTPSLASKWEISDDNMRFTFHLNPKARWTDGKPVTADDVIATYRLIADETLIDPMSREAIVNKMNEPVARSEHIVDIECKTRDWRNFISISGMRILPAHEIGGLAGKDYLDDYNFKYTATSGPYIVNPQDIKNNESLTLTRRKDYWGEDEPANEGLYNFDKIRFVVIRDQRLAFDKACKGELDFYAVYTAKWWVEDLDSLEAVKKGHLIRQKVFTRFPSGFQGLAFNMRHPLLDDLRLRKALGHLYDRKTMVAKFAYNEYDRLKSYYPNSDAENPANELLEYDPDQAARLLAEAGWKERGTDGILAKDGRRLSLTISYRSRGLEKYFTSYKEACRKAGVEINLSLLTPETQWKNVQERNFEISSMAWSAVLFPSPKQNYHSAMADEEGSNNITGFKNADADSLIEEYDQEFDLARRVELLKQLDAVIYNEHPYALAWYLPCERILYWNKFGKPKTVLRKYDDWRGVFESWWVDPDKEQKLKAARKSGAALVPIPELEVRPWDDHAGEKVARN